MVLSVNTVRQQLAAIANSGGSHKDQAEKYVYLIIKLESKKLLGDFLQVPSDFRKCIG